jgi:GT2 family glycosyltransferase
VVDNDSQDHSRSVLHAYADRGVRTRWNPTNRGFAGGANDGLASTDAPIVLISNFDIRPAPDYVATALRALLADERVGAVQGKLLRFAQAPDGGDVIDTTGHVAFTTRLFRNRGEGEVDRGQWDQPGEVFGISGALALYRRSMLEDVAIRRPKGASEPFDEDLFAFFEDVDLDWRCQRRGWQAHYEPRAVARHERGGAGVRRTAKVERLNFTNRLLVIARNDDGASLLRAAPAVFISTALKFVELALTVPSAVPGALWDLRKLRRIASTRAQLVADQTITPAALAQAWFEPFDWAGWVRTWWRRMRGVPPGS